MAHSGPTRSRRWLILIDSHRKWDNVFTMYHATYQVAYLVSTINVQGAISHGSLVVSCTSCAPREALSADLGCRFAALLTYVRVPPATRSRGAVAVPGGKIIITVMV